MAVRETSDIAFSSVNRRGVRPPGYAFPVGLVRMLPGGSLPVDYLVIAGGGGGSPGNGGGGGAGGFLTGTNFTASTGPFSITVGGGGASGVKGSVSVFSSIPSIFPVLRIFFTNLSSKL